MGNKGEECLIHERKGRGGGGRTVDEAEKTRNDGKTIKKGQRQEYQEEEH